MKNRKKIILFRVITPIFSIVLLLAVFEVFLRIIGYNPLQFLEEKPGVKLHLKKSPDKYIRYELNPGYRGVKFGSKIRINSSGFRGREYDIDGKDKFRICVLGDSVSFGFALDVKDTFSHRLEKYFSRDGIPAEVLNFSVEGYDILQEVLHFKKTGLKFSPDLVLVSYCLNDIGHTPLDIKDIRSLVSLKKSLRFVQFIRMKLDKLRLLDKLRKEMNFIKGKDQHFSELYKPVADDHSIDQSIKKIEKLLESQNNRPWLRIYTFRERIGKIRYSFEQLQKLAREKNFAVVIMILPFRIGSQEGYLYSEAHNIVRHEADRCMFEVLDMYAPLRDFGFKKVTIDGVHFNSSGHKVIAQTLYSKFKARVSNKKSKPEKKK